MYIGLRTKINDALSVDASINYTDSSSDFENNNYDRLRLSLGASYTF
jgi:long-subunit fatty acid transport protein